MKSQPVKCQAMKSQPVKSIAIVQSNYIPWRGYFDLIRAVDEFVILDSVQFTKNDWRNRNRIAGRGGPQWLTIPIRTAGRYGQRIAEAEVRRPALGAPPLALHRAELQPRPAISGARGGARRNLPPGGAGAASQPHQSALSGVRLLLAGNFHADYLSGDLSRLFRPYRTPHRNLPGGGGGALRVRPARQSIPRCGAIRGLPASRWNSSTTAISASRA